MKSAERAFLEVDFCWLFFTLLGPHVGGVIAAFSQASDQRV